MNAAILGAAVAFVILSVALTVVAFWAGWRLHRWASEIGLPVTPAPPVPTPEPVTPKLHVVGNPTDPRAPWVISRDNETETAP
ncbi:hypothetical protein [Mycobacterium sp. 48b]|uniref:hypothetical protein n=1 Tax=Mycobacterium sp. 48b TaxID=3400426 RepID=UPI003AADE1A4